MYLRCIRVTTRRVPSSQDRYELAESIRFPGEDDLYWPFHTSHHWPVFLHVHSLSVYAAGEYRRDRSAPLYLSFTGPPDERSIVAVP